MISLLVAIGEDNVIGYNHGMPWHLPNDLKFFKKTTTGGTIIMGRKTFDSIGKPLPNRTNVVITRKTEGFPDGIQLMPHIDTLLAWNKDNPNQEFFVIGGGTIFKQLMEHADRMYITYIRAEFPGDTYFPPFDENEWKITSDRKGIRDEKNPYDYSFVQYDRKE